MKHAKKELMCDALTLASLLPRGLGPYVCVRVCVCVFVLPGNVNIGEPEIP